MRKKVNIKKEVSVNKHYYIVNTNPLIINQIQNFKGERLVSRMENIPDELKEYVIEGYKTKGMYI
jgi:hypothetical protein